MDNNGDVNQSPEQLSRRGNKPRRIFDMTDNNSANNMFDKSTAPTSDVDIERFTPVVRSRYDQDSSAKSQKITKYNIEAIMGHKVGIYPGCKPNTLLYYVKWENRSHSSDVYVPESSLYVFCPTSLSTSSTLVTTSFCFDVGSSTSSTP